MKVAIAFIGALIFLVSPVCVPGVEVYKWVDERGTVRLTDDPKNVPEGVKDRVETILLPDRYEEPIRSPEKAVRPSEPEPERPKRKAEEPPSGFIPFDKFKYLTEGMSEAEVLSRLGPPTLETRDEIEVSGFSRRRGFARREALVKRYHYIGDADLGERTTVVHFTNGIVRKIERIFPPTW